MRRELQQFTPLVHLTCDNVNKYFETVRTKTNQLIINLHKIGVIDDVFLKHIIGVKKYGRKYPKIPGVIAKHFTCNQPAYAYPLFKTHKLDPNVLQTTPILDIPLRLLQSAGTITTSRITAFFEHLLSPISVIFCKYKFEEYCRDSKDYLESLATRKQHTSFNPNVENL